MSYYTQHIIKEKNINKKEKRSLREGLFLFSKLTNLHDVRAITGGYGVNMVTHIFHLLDGAGSPVGQLDSSVDDFQLGASHSLADSRNGVHKCHIGVRFVGHVVEPYCVEVSDNTLQGIISLPPSVVYRGDFVFLPLNQLGGFCAAIVTASSAVVTYNFCHFIPPKMIL